MVALGFFLQGIAAVLNSVLWLAWLLIIARVVVSWVSADPYNPLVRIIVQSTDPLMRMFGRWRLQLGGLDFTPIVVLLLIHFLQIFLVGTIDYYGHLLQAQPARM